MIAWAKLLTLVIRSAHALARAKERAKFEEAVDEIRKDPAGHLRRKFGRVRPDADSATLPGGEALPFDSRDL